MKIFLDEGLPYLAARLLREAGFDASHVLELGLKSASDTRILDHAASEGHVIVTLDSDFHKLLAMSGADRPSVIRIRVECLDEQAVARIVREVLAKYHQSLLDGAVVSVNQWQTRMRSLPLDLGDDEI